MNRSPVNREFTVKQATMNQLISFRTETWITIFTISKGVFLLHLYMFDSWSASHSFRVFLCLTCHYNYMNIIYDDNMFNIIRTINSNIFYAIYILTGYHEFAIIFVYWYYFHFCESPAIPIILQWVTRVTTCYR